MRVIEGVGLVIFDQDDRIMMLTSSSVKKDCMKSGGMLSIPIRTVEAGKSSIEALVRLMVEDVGNETIRLLPDPYGVFTNKLDDATTEKLTLFTGKCDIGFETHNIIQDCIFYGWLYPQALIQRYAGRIRPGIESIIG